LLSTGTVTVISARIPGQIADSVFRLTSQEKSAATVWDWNQRKWTKTDPQSAKVQVKHRTVRIVMLVILFATVIPIIIGISKGFFSKKR
jgi:hypothetical protein